MKDEDLKIIYQQKNGKVKVGLLLFWPTILLLLFAGVMFLKAVGEANAKQSSEYLQQTQDTMTFKGYLPWTKDQYSDLIAVIKCPGNNPIFLKSQKNFKSEEMKNCKYYLAGGVEVVLKATKSNPKGIISFRKAE